jgi:hypothetical protein
MSDNQLSDAPTFRWRLVTSAAICSLMLLGGCSDDGEQDDEGACTTPDDCSGDQVCQDGTCVAPDNNGGADGGDVSGDVDGGANNSQVGPEDYVISYTVRDRNTDEITLHAYSTTDSSRTQVTSDPELCASNCWLNDDLDTLVFTESSGQGVFDIIKAPVVDLAVQSDRTTLAQEVSDVDVVGNLVTYRRAQNDAYQAFYMSIDDGSEVEMGNLGSSSTTIGGWHIDPASDRQAIFLPHTQELQLRFNELGSSDSSDTYTYDAQNYQQVSGSYFSSSMPVAFSNDGQLAAFVTEAPNDYGTCSDASDCSGPVKRCGRHDRCTSIEVTVHFVDLDDIGSLGTQCDGAGSCGDVHRCYQPDGTSDTAECAPGRVVLGIPEFPAQSPEPGGTATGGCELTEGNSDYPYTKFNGPISFDSDGQLYGVAIRDCADGGNVGQSHILRVDPTTKEYEVVWGNEDGGYDGDLCWDSENLEPDDTECKPFITRARLSPQANELAMLATNPWVGDPARASANMDVWTVRRDGDDHSWVGGNETRDVVPRFSVHPAP